MNYHKMPTWLLKIIVAWDYFLRRLKLRPDRWHLADQELLFRGEGL